MKKLLVIPVCVSLILTGCASLEVNKTPYSGNTVSYIVDKNDNIHVNFKKANSCYADCLIKDPVYNYLKISCSEPTCELNYGLKKVSPRGAYFNEVIFSVDKAEKTKGSQKIYTYTVTSKTERKQVNALETFLSSSLKSVPDFDPDFYLANPSYVTINFEKEIPSQYQVVDIAGNFNRLGYVVQDQASNARNQYELNIKTDTFIATVPVETFAYRGGSITRIREIEFKFKSSSYIRDLSSAKKEVLDIISKAINL